MGNIFSIAMLIVVALAAALVFVVYPGQLFIWYLLVKPIVDGFLEQGATIGGTAFSFSYVPSLIIPSLFALLALFHANRLRHLAFKGFIIFYILLNVFAYFKQGDFDIGTSGYYIRVIFPIFLYFGVPLFVETREALERMIKIAGISGIFPCLMIFLQKLGFIQYNREPELLGSVIYERATGGYADSFSVALPIIISIFFLLNIIQCNKEKGRNQKIYEILLASYLFSLVFTFHRMSYIVIGLALCMWIYLNRRFGYAVIISIAIIFSFSTLTVFMFDFFGDIDVVGEKTTGATIINKDEGIGIASGALHGRGWLWTILMREYFNAPLIDQMFGIRMPGRAPHNDYIRVLFTVGAFGTAVYLFLLSMIGNKLLAIMRYYSRSGDTLFKNLSQTGMMMFMFYILGGVTLTISTLSTMSWYFWLLFGVLSHQYQLSQQTGKKKVKEALVLG